MPGTESDVGGYQLIQNRRSSASSGDLWSHSSPLRQLGLGTNATQKPHPRTLRKAAGSHCTSPLYSSTSEYTEYPEASFNAHGTTVSVVAWKGSAWSVCLDPLTRNAPPNGPYRSREESIGERSALLRSCVAEIERHFHSEESIPK
ncbi:hypothetical protein V502_04402 [Pseudogymnoascus sp. VKM F-4520 (FW-2644)]|nr:hypothetical protein V502_04402 [Pseudogymnoascus sp. VKM F-4520 (FW-2644)]